jgi:cytochrome c oxidase subunit 3
MRQRLVGDVSRLPTHGFGPESPMWWGTLGFIALEGTGFALAGGMYLYLAHVGQQWPIGAPAPDLWAGTMVTIILIASAIPNQFSSKWARAENLRKVRLALIVMTLFGVAPLIVRAFEFPAMRIKWDANAYGSIVWFLLGLHTTHLITDLGDTVVLTVLMWTRHGKVGKRLSDVTDNATYWNFVILSWLPIYFLIYWVPRL